MRSCPTTALLLRIFCNTQNTTQGFWPKPTASLPPNRKAASKAMLKTARKTVNRVSVVKAIIGQITAMSVATSSLISQAMIWSK